MKVFSEFLVGVLAELEVLLSLRETLYHIIEHERTRFLFYELGLQSLDHDIIWRQLRLEVYWRLFDNSLGRGLRFLIFLNITHIYLKLI